MITKSSFKYDQIPIVLSNCSNQIEERWLFYSIHVDTKLIRNN